MRATASSVGLADTDILGELKKHKPGLMVLRTQKLKRAVQTAVGDLCEEAADSCVSLAKDAWSKPRREWSLPLTSPLFHG